MLNINFVWLGFMSCFFSVSIFVITQDLWGNKISQNGRSWFSFRFAFGFSSFSISLILAVFLSTLTLFMSPQCSRKYICIYIENVTDRGKDYDLGGESEFTQHLANISQQGVPHRNNIYFSRCEPHVSV